MLQLKVTNQLTEAAELKKENFGMEMDVVTMKREQTGHTKGRPVAVVCLGRTAAAAAVVVAEAVAAAKAVRKVMMEHGKTEEVAWMLREVARAHLL